MKITRIFLVVAFLLSAACASFAYWEKRLWIGAAISVFWIILWWSSRYSELGFMPSVHFVGYVILCLVGSFLELRTFFLLLGVVAALNAWDADRFYRRWKAVDVNTIQPRMERKHLFRLLVVDGVSILLAAVGLAFKAQLKFGGMLLIGVLAVMSLSWLIRLLRNPGSKI